MNDKPESFTITPLQVLLLILEFEQGWSEADDIGFKRWLSEPD